MRLRLLLACSLLPHLAARELPLRFFTTNDGLVHNRVQKVVPDSRGLLWICTGGGISRFDGAQFQSFGLAQGLPYASINDMLETPAGDFWVASNGGGMIHFALSGSAPRFESFSVSTYPPANRVNTLYRAPDGGIWLGTDGGVFLMTVAANSKPQFSRVALRLAGHPEETVQAWGVITGADGSRWLGTRFGLVRILDDGRIIHYPIQPGGETDVVLSLSFPASDGPLWLSHQSGLIVFQPPAKSTYSAANRETVVDSSILRAISARHVDIVEPHPALPTRAGDALLFDTSRQSGPAQLGEIRMSKSGSILLFLAGGLYEFSGGHFTEFGDSRIRLAAQGTGAEDRDGNLWIATRTGALRVARDGLVTFRQADGLGSAVSNVFAGRDGSVMASSMGWRISRFDGQAFETVQLHVPPPVARVGWRLDQDVLEDRAGDWWVGTRAGLLRYSGVARFQDLAAATPRLYTARDGLAQDSVLRLFQDSRGDIWIASLIPGREVLTRWDRATGAFQRYSDADGLPAFNAPNSFYEDPRGAVWFSLRDGGIARYSNGRFRVFTERDGLPPGNEAGLSADHAGRLWFTNVRLGLFRIDDLTAPTLHPTFIAGPRELRGGIANRVLEDRAGNLYVTSGLGVFRLDAATLRINGLFTTSEGLADSDVYTVLADREGRLWFGTSQGLSVYQPPAALARHPAPPVRIGSLRVAGRERPVSPAGEAAIDGVELRPGGAQLEVGFFAVDFSIGEPTQYQYRLLGADDRWSDPSPLRSVQWANIAPGGYEFQVRAVTGSGEPGAQPAHVAFQVLPPVWRRWWFLALAAAAVLGAFVAFDRYRERARRVLAESEARYRTLAETASDVIVTIDDSGMITYVNRTVEAIFGYTPAELLGRELVVLMPENMRHRHRAGLARYRATGERRLSWKAIELPGLRKDGTEIPLEVAFGEFTRGGRHYFIGTIRDISERKHAEENLLRAREERLAELERVRQRIAADLHDEIGSSLTQISILSEVAHRRGADSDPHLSQPLSTIATASRELVDSMSDIVWAINPAKDHLSDLTQRMRRLAADTFTACNTAFHVELPPHDEDLKLGANLRREIFLIFKEGINNMVKHSGCTEAFVKLAVSGASLRLELRDNGKGFDAALPSDGHGLTSLRGRAAALGGTLVIVTAPGAGTSITLDIPIP